jgi:nitrate/nitrite transporter NarK
VADKSQKMHRLMYMVGLIVAGEAVFALPFHVTRFFRPSVLELFELSNTELGAAQGVYGILGMISYFLGGPLADRFPARKLLAASLWLTAAGGLYMTTFPGYREALFLWGFFGISSIMLFWAALIRATRDWGGSDEQGRAYGLLEGGRGLFAAVLASIAVFAFTMFFPDGYSLASFEEKREAMRIVIFGYTIATALAGVFVWFVISDAHPGSGQEQEHWEPGTENVWLHVLRVLRIPSVWLQALIILCAYVGYKGYDNYSLYAVQGYGMDEIEAAGIVTMASWMRSIAPIACGFLGDRFTISRMLAVVFGILLASNLFFATNTPVPGTAWVLIGNTLIGCTAVFGLRGLYFALLQEGNIPLALTGTAVGVISVVGFTPDIFVAYVGGILLDRSPGLLGHQHFFFFMAAFAAIGMIASYTSLRMLKRANG